ncbi:hypothetical protein PROFUN_04876 [Planoprotostelium fungivorum]|uniref:AB hydrolase-1 domain-containing protein n=1 Tax=Planoprotostelium fungivorum TaxID=1890364 RepID=A0A2P6NF61_9EUKA|nr:hypothetical protein PROFUN_04876 [Planoprotostelium fungivorum]
MANPKTQFYQLKDGTRLAYQIYGSEISNEVPLVMVTGLSAVKELWAELPLKLSHNRPVLVLDNRGVGESSLSVDAESTKEYGITILNMAKDVIALVESLGWRHIDLLGWSMGGMIAQMVVIELVKRRNDVRSLLRVRKLILCATTPKNIPSGIVPVLKDMFEMKASPKPEEKMVQRQKMIKLLTKLIQLNFSKKFLEQHPDVVAAVGAEQARYRVPIRVLQEQSRAVGQFDVTSELHLLSNVPTLLIHGSEDYVLGIEGTKLISKGVPHAEVAQLSSSDYGHWFFAEVDVVPAIDNFLNKKVTIHDVHTKSKL